jgi:hypothetical protein
VAVKSNGKSPAVFRPNFGKMSGLFSGLLQQAESSGWKRIGAIWGRENGPEQNKPDGVFDLNGGISRTLEGGISQFFSCG